MALKSDRAYGLATFGTFPLRNFWLLARGYWNRAESEYLDEMQSFIALTHDPRPYRQTAEAIDAVSVTLSHPLNQLLVPAVQATHNAVARHSGSDSLPAPVLNALQTHLPAGSDEVPKLSELGLPAETTTDPYTGEPLHVKRTPHGWLVYSVGKNFVDDGGKLEDLSDVGVGPPPPADKPAEK